MALTAEIHAYTTLSSNLNQSRVICAHLIGFQTLILYILICLCLLCLISLCSGQSESVSLKGIRIILCKKNQVGFYFGFAQIFEYTFLNFKNK
jgi:hypothetical protein